MSLAKDKEDILSMRRARIKGPGWERAWRADGTAHGSFGMARVPGRVGIAVAVPRTGKRVPSALCAKSRSVNLNLRTRGSQRVVKASLPFMWSDNAGLSVDKSLDVGKLKEKVLV